MISLHLQLSNSKIVCRAHCFDLTDSKGEPPRKRAFKFRQADDVARWATVKWTILYFLNRPVIQLSRNNVFALSNYIVPKNSGSVHSLSFFGSVWSSRLLWVTRMLDYYWRWFWKDHLMKWDRLRCFREPRILVALPRVVGCTMPRFALLYFALYRPSLGCSDAICIRYPKYSASLVGTSDGVRRMLFGEFSPLVETVSFHCLRLFEHVCMHADRLLFFSLFSMCWARRRKYPVASLIPHASMAFLMKFKWWVILSIRNVQISGSETNLVVNIVWPVWTHVPHEDEMSRTSGEKTKTAVCDYRRNWTKMYLLCTPDQLQ